MSNFIGLVYATLKANGIDYSDMSVSEAVDKFNELKGNTDKQKKAESEYKSRTLDEIRNKSLSHSKYDTWGNSGYSGGMSKRAVSAYESGEMPYSKWSKSAIIEAVLEYNDELTAEDLNRLSASDLRSMFLEKTSWHHTGKYFNETDFYSVDEDKVKNITREDFYGEMKSDWEYNEYEKDIENNPDIEKQMKEVYPDSEREKDYKESEKIAEEVSAERNKKYYEIADDYEEKIRKLEEANEYLRNKDMWTDFADANNQLFSASDQASKTGDAMTDIWGDSRIVCPGTISDFYLWKLIKKGLSKSEIRKQAREIAVGGYENDTKTFIDKVQAEADKGVKSFEHTIDYIKKRAEFGKRLAEMVKPVIDEPIKNIYPMELHRYQINTDNDKYVFDYDPQNKKLKAVYKFKDLRKKYPLGTEYEYVKFSKEPTFRTAGLGVWVPEDIKGEKIL